MRLVSIPDLQQHFGSTLHSKSVSIVVLCSKENTFCLARPAFPRRGPKPHLDLPLPPSLGPLKSRPRELEGPCLSTYVVGAAISHRAAPVLPIPPGGVSPLVSPHEMWVGRGVVGRRRPIDRGAHTPHPPPSRPAPPDGPRPQKPPPPARRPRPRPPRPALWWRRPLSLILLRVGGRRAAAWCSPMKGVL